MPKVREVVAALAINPNTVLKAYKELETKGLTSGRPGQGTFIDGTVAQSTLPELTVLRRSLRDWFEQADAAGLDEDGIVALVTSSLRDFSERREPSKVRGGHSGAGAVRAGPHERHRDHRTRAAATAASGRCVSARVAIPEGHLVALVGPNGAGKTTLLNLVVGLTPPTEGSVRVLGGATAGSVAALNGIAFVAQDMPLYRHLSVADMLHLTGNLNLRFDTAYARRRLGELGIDHKQKAGKLSGGQQAQLALTLALARHPRLLVLDEPTAPLDPVARHDFMATVLTAMTDEGVTVVLSSHMLAELERVTDYLVLISNGRVRLNDEVEDLLASHRLVSAATPDRLSDLDGEVIESSTMGAQTHQLIRLTEPDAPLPPHCEARPVGLEELALAYLRESPTTAAAKPGWSNPMTAIAAVPTSAARPVPWSRLAWVVWRRYRTMLIATIGVLAVIAIYLVINGEQMRSSYHAFTSCRPVNSAACQYKFQVFHDSYGNTGLIGVLLMFLPGIVGAFIGAPPLARELETGTFRFAWTQGAGRMRWATAVVVCGAVGVAVVMAAFGALISWHNQPLLDSGITPRLHTTIFPITGIAAAGWALAGFALGVLAGLLWRRVVPAIVTAFAALVRARLPRRHLPHALSEATYHHQPDSPLKALTISQWWTKGGVRVSNEQVTPRSAQSARSSTPAAAGRSRQSPPEAPRPGNSVDPVQYLIHHGYAQVTSYQPDNRYWPLQWIEFGWLATLAILLLGTAFWLLRRRPA